ncbi:MAG TPA: hypothetical protein VG817_01710 [Gemmatimonadales bacterium]|nr:hypothetical protein [Gemmatimonadales bacterium]
MEQLFGQPVFEVGSETYRWEDVVAFGILTGRLQGIEYRIRQGLACAAFADTQPEQPHIEEQVDEAAAEFRYARDLVTAEEAEDWLAARGLETDEWLEVIRREVLRTVYASRLDQLLRQFPPSQAEVLAAIRAEWLCADGNAPLLDGLAQWAAAAAADEDMHPEEELADESAADDSDLDELDFGDDDSGSATGGSITEIGSGTIGDAPNVDLAPYRARLTGLRPEAIQACVERLLRLRERHARYCLSAASPQGIRKEFDMHRLDWVRVDARALFFDTEAAAREGAFCIREDGMSVDQLATDAGTQVFDVRFLLTEVAEEVRPTLLAAQSREVVGPLWFDERWALLLVLDKILPKDTDEQLRHLSVESAVARAVATQVNHRVTWRLA